MSACGLLGMTGLGNGALFDARQLSHTGPGNPAPTRWNGVPCIFGSRPIPFRRTHMVLYRRGGFQTRPCGISRRNRLPWAGAHLRVRPVWDVQRADTQVGPYPLKRVRR